MQTQPTFRCDLADSHLLSSKGSTIGRIRRRRLYKPREMMSRARCPFLSRVVSGKRYITHKGRAVKRCLGPTALAPRHSASKANPPCLLKVGESVERWVAGCSRLLTERTGTLSMGNPFKRLVGEHRYPKINRPERFKITPAHRPYCACGSLIALLIYIYIISTTCALVNPRQKVAPEASQARAARPAAPSAANSQATRRVRRPHKCWRASPVMM